ncbi:MAG: pyridoxal-phosphate dependent enzyme [Vicingaceae bacterium]
MNLPSPCQELKDSVLDKYNLSLWIKRDDLIHPHVSGNKWRKLKYNIQAAKAGGNNVLLTFGGAFSNHIAATASAGKIAGLKTIGVIRGDEFFKDLNSTLNFAQNEGMKLHFINRSDYARKEESGFLNELKSTFGDFFLVPEGGANEFGVKGCAEILTEEEREYDYICCPAGTGTTAAGVLMGMQAKQQLLAFSALKGGEQLAKEVLKWNDGSKSQMLQMIGSYHFGGYAKVKTELIDFTNDFYLKHQIPLDLIYTAKMMYGLYDLIQRDYFPSQSKILFIHSGGLQGNEGFRQKGINVIC